MLRALRDDPATAGIPVVIFTAMRLTQEEGHLLDQLANARLDKIEGGREELAAAVARTLMPVPAGS